MYALHRYNLFFPFPFGYYSCLTVIKQVYYLKYSKTKLQELGSGSIFKELSTNSLLSFKIPIIPIQEQKRIVKIIESKLSAVEILQKAIMEQQLTSEALFSSYIQQHITNKNGKKMRLGDICIFTGGSQPPKSTFIYHPKKGYTRLVQIQDFRKDDTTVYIPSDTVRRTFSKGDVMIGRYGPPVFQILRGLEGAYNVALMKATPIDVSVLDNNFLFYLLQEKDLQNAVINQSQRSAGQSGVDKEFLEKQYVFIPDIRTQKAISIKIDKHKQNISILDEKLKAQSTYINSLSQAILRHAFEGKL